MSSSIARMTISAAVATVVAAALALPASAAVVGHDIGTMVAFAYAARYPDQTERLLAGRERIYLDRFWNEFAGNPARIDEATRTYYAKLYARPVRCARPLRKTIARPSSPDCACRSCRSAAPSPSTPTRPW